MPIAETNTHVAEFPTARLGINLCKSPVELNAEECLLSQNLIWRHGMKKRGGSSLVTSNTVNASNPITGLHKFYMNNGSSQLLASANAVVSYLSGSSWVNAVTGQTSGLQTFFSTWGALNKVYITNGTDKMQSWNGSAAASFALADGVPLQTLSYQDRLLTIIGGTLTWSASFDDTAGNWLAASSCGVKPDTLLNGMCIHCVTNTSSGYFSNVLLAGANGMYLFSGTNLTTPSTSGNYAIYSLACQVGCNAVRTMCWTPAGTMWLGNDLQVYILPFNSNIPIQVGIKIRSNIAGTPGIEQIPSNEIQYACAVYHDGFYKLSFTPSGQSNNSKQFWFDVMRMQQDNDGYWGPWYGPMIGQSLSCFFAENGAGDYGQLVAGESSAVGNVYYVHSNSYYGDIAPATGASNAIQLYYQTYYNGLGNNAVEKDIHQIELELMNVLGTVNINFMDITGTLNVGSTISLSGNAVLWDNGDYWGQNDWTSSMPARWAQPVDPVVHTRRLSLSISSASNNDTFEFYAARAEVKEQNKIFGP